MKERCIRRHFDSLKGGNSRLSSLGPRYKERHKTVSHFFIFLPFPTKSRSFLTSRVSLTSCTCTGNNLIFNESCCSLVFTFHSNIPNHLSLFGIMKFFTIASLLSVVGLASATNYTVIVGGNGTLTYNPSSISGVNVGDTIAFQLYVILCPDKYPLTD